MIHKFKDKSKEEINKIIGDAWLGIYVPDESKLFNPLMNIPENWEEEPEIYLTWLFRQPEYFSFYCKEILNVGLLPAQAVILKELWNHKFPIYIASRGFGKSFLMAVYAIMRATLLERRQIMVVGSAFRQSKVVYEYVEKIYENAPLLRSICGSKSIKGASRHMQDMWKFHLNDSTITACPIGHDGQKIRGQRAQDIFSDEFASQSEEIFENVISGFASVKSDPIHGVKQAAAYKMYELLKEFTVEQEDYELDSFKVGNQTILSGTAYYEFNHFYRYWKDWKEIIESGGDKDRLERYFRRKAGEAKEEIFQIPPDFNWQDFCIIRIPEELVPPGFMDEANIARAKATINSNQYSMEYGATFSKDSQGFFKRSLVESCVAKEQNQICLPSEKNIVFRAQIRGNSESRYVYGVDPASQVDNFSIIVLNLKEDHKRIVYCWTSSAKEHKELIKLGVVDESDFYAFCARKIRQLQTVFPCARIGMDAQGGGYAVADALHDPARMLSGEKPLWEVIEHGNPKDTDGKAGEHIIELVQFANYEWLSGANHGLRKAFEDKTLLFPHFDAIEYGLAGATDLSNNKSYDTLEDCVLQIEELKDELSTIVMTQTEGGKRDRWDTPEIKLPGSKKGRMRKDRYSALLIANAVANNVDGGYKPLEVGTYGGFANDLDPKEKNDGDMYYGPDWLVKRLENVY